MTTDAGVDVRETSGRKMRGARRGAIAVFVGGAIMAAMIAALGWLGGLRINLTPSAPIGLWRIVPLNRRATVGDLVMICPPGGAVSEFGLERGYFRRGLCHGGAAPLIKDIAATSDAYIQIGSEVTIDGGLLPRSWLRPFDGQGRSLTPWSGGVVPPGEVFLYSPFEGSYDSRYFGPVPEAGLLGRARPILTLDP